MICGRTYVTCGWAADPRWLGPESQYAQLQALAIEVPTGMQVRQVRVRMLSDLAGSRALHAGQELYLPATHLLMDLDSYHAQRAVQAVHERRARAHAAELRGQLEPLCERLARVGVTHRLTVFEHPSDSPPASAAFELSLAGGQVLALVDAMHVGCGLAPGAPGRPTSPAKVAGELERCSRSGQLPDLVGPFNIDGLGLSLDRLAARAGVGASLERIGELEAPQDLQLLSARPWLDARQLAEVLDEFERQLAVHAGR